MYNSLKLSTIYKTNIFGLLLFWLITLCALVWVITVGPQEHITFIFPKRLYCGGWEVHTNFILKLTYTSLICSLLATSIVIITTICTYKFFKENNKIVPFIWYQCGFVISSSVFLHAYTASAIFLGWNLMGLNIFLIIHFWVRSITKVSRPVKLLSVYGFVNSWMLGLVFVVYNAVLSVIMDGGLSFMTTYFL